MNYTDPKKYIYIKGARCNNLKNIDVAIPRNSFTVITGLSGSGKSSLAFDTLFAEGQRRYVESLSSYARQFLGRMSKPEVDFITGLSPAIAIEQKVNNKNPRSTVGTGTEIYEYIKLLYARIGRTLSPISGEEVKRHTVTDVVDRLLQIREGLKVTLFAPMPKHDSLNLKEHLQLLIQQGFTRISVKGEIGRIHDMLEKVGKNPKDIRILIDRFTIKHNDHDLESLLFDSVQTAFHEGYGKCEAEIENGETLLFSNLFELDGMTFEKPSENFFNFNTPHGACKTCEGYGSVIGISEDLVIANPSLSVYDDAVACWRGEKMSEWKNEWVMNAYKFDFPIHKPYRELTPVQKALLWEGNEICGGINTFFKWVEEQSFKIQYRVMLARFRGKMTCPDCQGTRLRKDAGYVKIAQKSIQELALMPISQLRIFFDQLAAPETQMLTETEHAIAKRLLTEICNRLGFLIDVGLEYLTLNRLSSSLSGGETQRINLATSIGSSLVGSLYILDEPSIGLHTRDTHNLIKVLKKLRDLGNTVIVVEHDEEIMRAADYIVDVGPLAGEQGGEIVYAGKAEELLQQNTLTAEYLNGKKSIPVPAQRRKWRNKITLHNVYENNLKYLTVSFPMQAMTVVTGVSGSGKTSLVKRVLYPAIKRHLGLISDEQIGKFESIDGDLQIIHDVELVDQNPIGRSSRSNPATYVKAYDDIRQLYAEQKLAKTRNYKPGFFSFNTEGGRCETCQGEGFVTIEMQFMADVKLVCEECNGKRFKEEVLEVQYKDHNIADILNLSINQAIEFFDKDSSTVTKRIINKLKPLQDVGLGYLRLGQSSSSLSGGEAQRIKLAYFLTKGNSDKNTLFIFDEPTTGLHFHDISNLKRAFDALIANGHSIIVIEHHEDIIKTADWIIDLGPEGGNEGGNIVFEGTPEDLIKNENSYTGRFLKKKLL